MEKENMRKALVPILIILIVVVGAGSFYGGMIYGRSKSGMRGQQGFGQMGGGPGGMASSTNRRVGNQGMSFINGEILANDGKTMTVKINTGGSKIILFSDNTEIGKMASGTASDLTVGQNIMVNGKTNTDGSITASSVQIRPSVDIGGGAPSPDSNNGQPPAPIQ